MQSTVASKFAAISAAERGQLVSSVHRYVSNSQFGNIVQNIDINNVRSDAVSRRSPGNLYSVCSQLAAFNGIPGLSAEVLSWLNSV